MLGQIIFSLLLLVPVFYWIMINTSKPSTPELKDISFTEKKISVILPMRNEISNVERKLSSMIDEIHSHPLVELIVADSDSEDGTKERAKEKPKKNERKSARKSERKNERKNEIKNERENERKK